jgi:hypothetical protein
MRKVIRWYQDETGILELKWSDVAEWAQRKGVTMPVPPTPVEMMARNLAAVARSERRNEAGSEYRGNARLS